MSDDLKQLFKRLDFAWNISGEEFKGENPACGDLLNEILAEIKQLDEKDVISIMEELSDGQIEQITPIIEEIIGNFSNTEKTLIKINMERNIKWLNSELKFLGII